MLNDELLESLSFSADGHRLVTTTLNNKIIVWYLASDPEPKDRPFLIEKRFMVESDVLGVTSATMFDAPSGKPYILVTTWPSSERAKNGGEFSFVSPVGAVPSTVPVEIEHPIIDPEDLSPIVAGAVSPFGDLVALLDKVGRIHVLPLANCEAGGLYTTSALMDISGERQRAHLDARKIVSNHTLRFIWTSECLKLYALDPRGHLIVLDCKCDNAPIPKKPLCSGYSELMIDHD